MELKELEKVDTRNMYKPYDDWPNIAYESYNKTY